VDPLSVKRRLSCILAADAVGYSRQMEQDEESTIRVLAAHRAVIDGIITFHGGRIISTAGDSVLAEFSSVVEAVRCAVEVQEALKTRNDALPDKSQMHFRVGVNLGDVVVKNDDLLGDGVNVAARLETTIAEGHDPMTLVAQGAALAFSGDGIADRQQHQADPKTADSGRRRAESFAEDWGSRPRGDRIISARDRRRRN